MAIRCIFFTTLGGNSCQVLRMVNAAPRARTTQDQLEDNYCKSGRFIACPVFCKVERGLVEVNRLRKGRPLPPPHVEQQSA